MITQGDIIRIFFAPHIERRIQDYGKNYRLRLLVLGMVFGLAYFFPPDYDRFPIDGGGFIVVPFMYFMMEYLFLDIYAGRHGSPARFFITKEMADDPNCDDVKVLFLCVNGTSVVLSSILFLYVAYVKPFFI